MYRQLAANQLPRIIDHTEPIGPIGLSYRHVLWCSRPPTTSKPASPAAGRWTPASSPSCSAIRPWSTDRRRRCRGRIPTLDAMRLNWGPYLWMRCYNNGAQFLDRVVGPRPDWAALESGGDRGAGRLRRRERPAVRFSGAVPRSDGPTVRVDAGRTGRRRRPLPGVAGSARLPDRAWACGNTKQAGQRVKRISVSGGIARSELMGVILATVLGRPVERLVSAKVRPSGRRRRRWPDWNRTVAARPAMIRHTRWPTRWPGWCASANRFRRGLIGGRTTRRGCEISSDGWRRTANHRPTTLTVTLAAFFVALHPHDGESGGPPRSLPACRICPRSKSRSSCPTSA